MQLSIYDRLKILGLLPQKSSFEGAIVISELRKKIDITPEDVKTCDIKTLDTSNGSQIVWDIAKDPNLDVTLTTLESELIKTELKSLNDKKEIEASPAFLEFYKKLR